jgi:hypothetical protein
MSGGIDLTCAGTGIDYLTGAGTGFANGEPGRIGLRAVPGRIGQALRWPG